MSPEAEQRLISQVRRDPKRTSAQLSQIDDVSPSTIQRILQTHGYIRAICCRKPILRPLNVAQRLEWASANVNRDWRRVTFTDEALFEVSDNYSKEMCWRLPHEETCEGCLRVRKKRGKIIPVWGAIIHGHKSPLVHQKNKVKVAAQTINADVYLEQIIKGPLVKAVTWAHGQGLAPLVPSKLGQIHIV